MLNYNKYEFATFKKNDLGFAELNENLIFTWGAKNSLDGEEVCERLLGIELWKKQSCFGCQ